jgi:hypothetical protein
MYVSMAKGRERRWRTFSTTCQSAGGSSLSPARCAALTKTLRRSDPMGLTWVKMVLDPFPEKKGSPLPGRNPASIKA